MMGNPIKEAIGAFVYIIARKYQISFIPTGPPCHKDGLRVEVVCNGTLLSHWTPALDEFVFKKILELLHAEIMALEEGES